MRLCDKCCEKVGRVRDGSLHDVCRITGSEDLDKEWEEGQDPTAVCETYRGPIGFDWDKWREYFRKALSKEAKRALDDGSIRPSELVRALRP